MNETQKLAHLLRRAGFGAAPRELTEARRAGYEATREIARAIGAVSRIEEGSASAALVGSGTTTAEKCGVV